MQVSLLILVLVVICNNGINAKPPSKIVGGCQADITDAPFTVMIFRWFNLNNQILLVQCAGSIISNRYILTAAHCLENPIDPGKPVSLESFDIIAGENFYHPDAKIYRVEKLYLHPNYTHPVGGGPIDGVDLPDIGVIKLKDEIPFGPTRRSIELANRELSSPGIGLSYGWGYTGSVSSQFPRPLQQIMLGVYNSADCAILYPYHQFNKDELCTRALCGRGGPCDGDSGGPLVINGELAGVFSNTNRRGVGYYIDVFHHKTWIESIVHGTTETIVYSTTDSSYFTYHVDTSRPSTTDSSYFTYHLETSRPSTKWEEPYTHDELKK